MDHGLDSFQRAMGMDMNNDPSIKKAMVEREKWLAGDRAIAAEKRVAELEALVKRLKAMCCDTCDLISKCDEKQCLAYKHKDAQHA